MSDETSTDPAPEAKATPEQEGDALKEVLGDEFEEFQAFRQSKQGWDSQQNKHNEAAARAAKEAAEARDELLKALAGTRPPQNGKQQQRPASALEFAQHLGFDPSADPGAWDEPMTLKQAYMSYYGLTDWALKETGTVKEKLSSIETNVSQFTERFSQSDEGFAKYLAATTIDSLEEKYPELDREEMFDSIRKHADLSSDDLMNALERDAQSSHQRMESKLSEREKKRRGKRTDRTYRGAGKSSAVAGESLPSDISSPEFMQQFLKRHPAPVDGLRDEDNV